MSAGDPVAEVVARVLAEHEEIPVFGCTCTPVHDDGTKDVLPVDYPEHTAQIAAAALRAAGLISEATTRVEWGVQLPGGQVVGPFPEDFARRSAAGYDDSRALACRTVTDHVAEWEVVE